MNPQQVAQLVKSEINKAISGLANRSVYRAEVVAVAGSRVNVIMEHASGVHPNILCMSGYQPMVGDQVLILNIGLSGSNFICIGRTNSVGTSGNPIGEIQMTLKASPDFGFLLMAGGTYNRVDYPLMWETVAANGQYGTTAQHTFTLTDMSKRIPVAKGASGDLSTLGEIGGTETHTHVLGNNAAAQIGSKLGEADTLSFRDRDVGVMNGSIYTLRAANIGNASSGQRSHNTALTGSTDSSTHMPRYKILNFQVRAR